MPEAKLSVANSAGTRRPHLPAPPGACDAHMHIYDAGFAHLAPAVGNATVNDYRRLQARLGTQRTVVVTPRECGLNNAVTLDAIRQLGIDNARGVAVVSPDVGDAELQALHAGGIRGIRFTLYTPEHAVVGFEMVEELSHRVHALGWHLQLHWTARQIADNRDLLLRLPSTIVFDHLARIPVDSNISHPAFAIVRSLLDSGRTWLKLSGAYLDSKLGACGGYADTDAVAKAWVRIAPERLVWGSDWPHPTEKSQKPDDAVLFDLLARWSGNEAMRQRILVDNPAALYGFDG